MRLATESSPAYLNFLQSAPEFYEKLRAGISPLSTGGKAVLRWQRVVRCFRVEGKRLWLVMMLSVAVRGQGPAPETAPPLFPGGCLISYNSILHPRRDERILRHSADRSADIRA